MDISLIEHRELADYIARKLVEANNADAMVTPHIAAVVWDAIEDYTATKDNAPDAEDTGRADDWKDNYFTRSL